MVVFAVVDIADILVLNGFMDWTVCTRTQQTSFEVFCCWTEISRILFVTEIAGGIDVARINGGDESGC